jgi:putative sterol carrier protein
MPVFPSKEWCEEVTRLANADPESADAGEGWEGDFGAIIEAEQGKLANTFAVHWIPKDGRISQVRVLGDADELEEIEPSYLARAPYSVWKGIIQGKLDPMEQLVKRRLTIAGDAQPLMERIRYKGMAARILSKLSTEFADEP